MNRDNTYLTARWAAHRARATHCPNGHEWTAANTYHRPDGARVCRACKNEKSRADKAERRALPPVVAATAAKTCTRCAQSKPLTEFGLERTASDGRRTRCKVCTRETTTAERDAAPDSRRTIGLAMYGLTPAAYDQMLADQGGVCAVCGRCETTRLHGRVRNLAVDHDHSCCPGRRSCGKCVRRLLCAHCNLAAGYVRDDPAVARRLAEYLTNFR